MPRLILAMLMVNSKLILQHHNTRGDQKVLGLT